MLYVLVFKCHCSTNPEDKLFIIYFALIFVFHFFFLCSYVVLFFVTTIYMLIISAETLNFEFCFWEIVFVFLFF